jgi:hypothetical protein
VRPGESCVHPFFLSFSFTGWEGECGFGRELLLNIQIHTPIQKTENETGKRMNPGPLSALRGSQKKLPK